MTVELEDLVGLHELSGVGYETFRHDEGWDYSQAMHFILDGVTYTAREDKKDGYRSAMEDIAVSNADVPNRFVPVRVFCSMRERKPSEWEQHVLEMRDVITGKIVLSVGTEDVDDYYPGFVADWRPENLVHNQQDNHDATN